MSNQNNDTPNSKIESENRIVASDIDRKIDEILANNMWVDVKTGKVNFVHARKDLLALMNKERKQGDERM